MWVYAKKNELFGNTSQKFYIQHTINSHQHFLSCFCMTFWCETWKSFEFNLLSFEARTKITWVPANLHDCYSEQHVEPSKKSIYEWFNSNFFYSCDCPFFVETTLANFHIFRVWRCGQCAFCFFAFSLPILTFDFYFWNLPDPFNSICELRLNCISLN